jgi:hypothetical protein
MINSMKNQSKSFCLMVLTLLLALTACNYPPAVNPWIDDSIPSEMATTPSRDSFLAVDSAPMVRQREYPETNAPHVDQQVAHYPLWWEDPFEDQGDNDNTFAWTWQDYVAMPYGLGRYLLNTMLWPVSAVVTPPGTSMVSDGILPPQHPGLFKSHPHDARRGISPNPTANRLDFGYYETEQPLAVTEPEPETQ